MEDQDTSQQSQQPYQEQPYQQQSFPQPSTKQNEPVPGPPAMPGMPEQPVKKRSALAGFFTFIILLFLGVVVLGVFILMSTFIHFSSQSSYYVAVAIISLVGGALFGLIAKELSQTDKGYLWLCSLISSLIAGLVSTFVNIHIFLSQKLAVATQEANVMNLPATGLLSAFPEPSNPLITSLLIITFFNIPVLIIFFRMKEKKIWHLVIYLLPIIIFLAIFYLLPLFILPQILPLLETFL